MYSLSHLTIVRYTDLTSYHTFAFIHTNHNQSRACLYWLTRSFLRAIYVTGSATHFELSRFAHVQPLRGSGVRQKLSPRRYAIAPTIQSPDLRKLTFNQVVRGSNPRCLIKKNGGSTVKSALQLFLCFIAHD